MPNRTVVVRLGVDSSDAVAGLKRVASAAKTTAADVKRSLSDTRVKVDAGSSLAELRKVKAEAKSAASASVAELQRVAKEARTTAAAGRALNAVKVRFESSAAVTGLRNIVNSTKTAVTSIKDTLRTASAGVKETLRLGRDGLAKDFNSLKVRINSSSAVTEVRKLGQVARATGSVFKTQIGRLKASVDANPAVRGLRRVVDAARTAGEGIKTHFRTASNDVDKVGRSAGGLGGKLKKVGVAGAAGLAVVAGGAIGVGVGLGKAINKAGTFEATMRQVGKQTGLSGAQLEDFTQLAIEMGAETSFSAQGASDAMLELAKGGMSAADQQAGALKETLTLATAGGLELGDAAGYMVQGLNTFGLKAEDAGRVSAALAGAANASTASVEDLGVALGQVGPGAALAGVSIEETAAALSALTNNGVQGSDAGTSLKTMFTSLTPSTKKAAEAFADLNLLTEDGASKFYDANGEMRSLTEVAGLLEQGLKGMSSEQRTSALRAAFGADAYRAAAILAKEGAGGIAEYTRATSDAGAAQELAQSATEGYSGALERFQGSIETAQIQLGRKFLPILSKTLDYLSGPGMDTLTAAATILRDTFAPQLDKASGGIQRFLEYISSNQAAVIETFRDWGNGVFDFGIVVAKMAAGGLRAIGDFTLSATASVFNMVGSIIKSFNSIPFLKGKFDDSIAAFEDLRESAIRGAADSKASLYGLADGIDDKVIPSVESMRGRFNDAANTQIIKAEQRDSVIKMGRAFEAAGKLIGSGAGQVNSYKDAARELGKTSSDLNKTLGEAKGQYEDTYEAARKGGAKQTELNKITKGYRTQLIDTLTQMVGNREEAVKLAEKYDLMPDKVVTDAEFKHKAASASAKAYREYVNEQQEKHNILSEAEWDAKKASKDSRTYREYVNDEQAKHEVLSEAEWDARVAKGSAKAYREYVNAEQKKHKVLSEAEWDARKAKNDDRSYREYVNDQQSRHRVLSKAEWDARNAKADAVAYRRYVNAETGKIDKSIRVKINWDTAVDDINTKLTLKYGKGARLMAAGGPSKQHGHSELDDLNRSVGAPVSAPTPEPGPKGGGPSFGQVYRQGTRSVLDHGTGATKALLKQYAPELGYDGGSPGSPGGSIGTRKVGAGWGPVQAAMRRHGATTFNTYPGHHPSMERARDVYPHNWAAANAARALSSVWYVIYRMKIASKNHGNGWRQYKPTNFRGDWRHEKHIHVARYDRGGGLKPGVTMAVNGTGKTEHVVTDARWQQLMNNRSGPARIDSADMARLVDALTQRVPAQLNVYNPVREPASRSIAAASNYASR